MCVRVYCTMLCDYHVTVCRFQQYFLEQLESRIDFENVQDSRIGEIFVKMVRDILKYTIVH